MEGGQQKHEKQIAALPSKYSSLTCRQRVTQSPLRGERRRALPSQQTESDAGAARPGPPPPHAAWSCSWLLDACFTTFIFQFIFLRVDIFFLFLKIYKTNLDYSHHVYNSLHLIRTSFDWLQLQPQIKIEHTISPKQQVCFLSPE